jgi:hypothetical protein
VGTGSWVWYLRPLASNLGFKVQGLGFRAQGVGSTVLLELGISIRTSGERKYKYLGVHTFPLRRRCVARREVAKGNTAAPAAVHVKLPERQRTTPRLGFRTGDKRAEGPRVLRIYRGAPNGESLSNKKKPREGFVRWVHDAHP